MVVRILRDSIHMIVEADFWPDNIGLGKCCNTDFGLLTIQAI